jgi:two-component SAPR family response regulator
MDILKRIDQAQQFCKQYADGAWSIETENWNHHVTPEFIEDIRQYIESLQLKLMHEQSKQAKARVCVSESYEMLDRFLRNNLHDDDYESYSSALDEVAKQMQPPLLEEKEIVDLLGNCENGGWFKYHAFARAIESAVRKQFGVQE